MSGRPAADGETQREPLRSPPGFTREGLVRPLSINRIVPPRFALHRFGSNLQQGFEFHVFGHRGWIREDRLVEGFTVGNGNAAGVKKPVYREGTGLAPPDPGPRLASPTSTSQCVKSVRQDLLRRDDLVGWETGQRSDHGLDDGIVLAGVRPVKAADQLPKGAIVYVAIVTQAQSAPSIRHLPPRQLGGVPGTV
jgi:hypothetical protein